MKKHFYLLVVPILLAIVMGSCTSMDCYKPYYFTIVVKKGSPEYPLFLKDSLIDEKDEKKIEKISQRFNIKTKSFYDRGQNERKTLIKKWKKKKINNEC